MRKEIYGWAKHRVVKKGELVGVEKQIKYHEIKSNGRNNLEEKVGNIKQIVKTSKMGLKLIFTTWTNEKRGDKK